MRKSPHLCHLPISTNLRDLGAMIWQKFQSTPTKSGELARAGCGCGSTTAVCSQCSNEPAPLPVTFFGFPLPPLFLSSTGAKLILWIRPTILCSRWPLSPQCQQTTSLLGDLVLMLTTFLVALAITFPFLAFLALLASFAKAVHLRRILTSAGFDVGLNFTSNLLVRDQS